MEIIRYWRFCLAVLALVMSAPVLAGAIDEATAQRLYEESCSACHGERGNGQSRASFALDPPPRDFTTPEAWRQLSRERMLTSVTYGRPGTAMVGFEKRLDKAQIAGIVDYIRAHFMRPPPKTEDDSGAAIFRKHCAVCHGDRGSGANWTRYTLNPAPRDFTAPESRAELSRERMLTSVTYGRPGTAMMSFSKRLDEQQIAAVVDYIRSEFMRPGKTPAKDAPAQAGPSAVPSVASAHAGGQGRAQAVAVDMAAPLPGGLEGDAVAGRRFFMHNCYTCHGRAGNGKGPRADFISPPPRNFLGADARRRLNRPALFRAIAMGLPGTVMPAWSKVLDEQQIANVAEFVFTAFIRPQAPQGQVDGKKN